MPRGSLSQARLTALCVGGLAALIQLTQLGNPARSPEYIRLSAAAIVLLVGSFVFAYRSGRAPWWTMVSLPVLVALGASGLKDPLAGASLAIAAAMVLSLFGSTPVWLFRTLGAMVSIPIAVAISPQSAGRDLDWHSGTVLSIVPQVLLIAGMMRGLHLALMRQELTAEREAVLAGCGREMLGVTRVEDVREIGRTTAEKLIALEPGVALVILRTLPDGGLRMANLAGAPAGLRGRSVDPGVLAEPAAMAALLPGFSHWHLETLGANPESPQRYMVVGGRREVPAEVLDTFRNLSHLVMLSENGCHVHAELEQRANHDHLTQLPNRAKFLRAVDNALAGAPGGTVALLNIDLDNFKQVNDGHGHTGGDELLVQVAAALTGAADGRGLAGRFGGDEFALLLTELHDPAEADEVAARLCARLAVPILLSTGTVTVGASVGVAVAEPGITVLELTRRADIAMYSAKAAGKNQIDTFPPRQAPSTAHESANGTGPALVAGFRDE